MKKVLFFVAALLTLVFAACSKEDPNPYCWEVTASETEGDSTETETVYVWCNESEVLLYQEDLKKIISDNGFSTENIAMKYAKSGDSQSECEAKPDFDKLGCYEYSIRSTANDTVYYADYYWVRSTAVDGIYLQINKDVLPSYKEKYGDYLYVQYELTDSSTKEECESKKSK